MVMALAFWGRKSKEYMQQIMKLFPLEEIDTVVDACMGSGSFSRNISCRLADVKRIAIELDKSLVTMHQEIKNNSDKVIQKMLECSFSDELYLYCRRITREFNSEKASYDRIEIAFAELVLLYFSYNSMRGNVARRFDSYTKYDNEKKYNEAKYHLERVKNRFWLKAPSDVIDLSNKWQRLDIVNDSFINHTDLWENEKCWIYIDTPYELHKRGIIEEKVHNSGNLGYDVDMSTEEHELFVSRIIQYVTEEKLHAKMMICTNYELDEKGQIIVPKNDRYARLLEYGFTRKLIEYKACSNTYICTENSEGGAKRKRHRKIEAVYINYKTI